MNGFGVNLMTISFTCRRLLLLCGEMKLLVSKQMNTRVLQSEEQELLSTRELDHLIVDLGYWFGYVHNKCLLYELQKLQ